MADLVFSKVTLVTRLSEVFYSAFDNESYIEEISGVLVRMTNEGKTDGAKWITYNVFDDQLVVNRRWVSLEAAEEWCANLQEVHNKYQIPIISMTIEDYLL
jgi:hypothetical protein